ncbi:MAG: MFS transporter [Firmicutes bacterium]|nr:MFS transporter [Bacillota bacterium]
MIRKNGIKVGILYFYIHFIVEVICFYYLSKITNNSNFVWIIPFIYDGLAFVPQSLIGYISDKNPKINFGIIGCIFLLISYLIYGFLNINIYISLIILCLGNCFLHISGAESTLKTSNGKLSPAAIFVSGGSFGVITGKLLAKTTINPLVLLIPILSLIPFIILADTYKEKNDNTDSFNYVKENNNPYLVIIIAIFIVIVRGYMGYGIPTSWNKTTTQTILLFFTMGIGKALGGILSDKFGIKKIAILSTLFAIPFLCFGDKVMIVSLIGVMLFSMTMAITLEILVSVLKNTPGFAFGLTTIGLFLGTAPIFFIKLTMTMNIIIIVIFSLICAILLSTILKGDKS